MDSFADIIALWPNAAALAEDLETVGVIVTPVTVRSWRGRGVPGEYWDPLVEVAQRRGFQQVNADVLCRLGRMRTGRTARAAR